MIDDATVERAAKALERATTAAEYGWPDDAFEIWWNHDPLFTQKINNWGYFKGTKKEKLLWETRIVLEAAQDAR